MKPKAVVDMHPRTLELLFNPGDLKRLKSSVSMTVWEGSRMPADQAEKHLPDASFIIGQTALPRERLERAQQLKAIINVEGNFPSNIDYEYCFVHGIHVLSGGVAFGTAVAEMALGLALALARIIPELEGTAYDGWLSLELEKRWYPDELPSEEEAFRRSAAFLRGLLTA